MREQVPHATIAAVLGRSEASLRHAIKNTLYQQLLHHMPADILTYYRMQEENLYDDVVNPVYYQTINDASSCDTENTDISECDVSVQHTNNSYNNTCDYIVTSALTFLFASGAAVYFHVLLHNWNAT